MSLIENQLYQIKPPPPPTLSKELLGVWCAWSRMGDREVVREAVAKGLHIEWAQTFLATRKGLELCKTQAWFKEEVFLWVYELLSRRQIFKATHILNNINLAPLDEFNHIFLETVNCDLRNYLGIHLEKSKRLDESQKQAWNLLEIIRTKSDILALELSNEESLSELSVSNVLNRSAEWRYNVGTRLFFNTLDFILTPFVRANYAWNFLLKHDKLDLLKLWINVYFSKNVTCNSSQEQLTSLFLNLKIDKEMIDFLFNSYISESTQQVILNELSKFGIFTEHERDNVECILSRIADIHCFNNFCDVLKDSSSVVTIFQFHELLLEYCVENQLYTVLNWCHIDFNNHKESITHLNSKHLDLLVYLNSCDYLFDKKNVGLNILRISKFLSNSNNLLEYISLNPLIFLSLVMFLCDDRDLLNIFTSTQKCNLENFTLNSEIIRKSIKSLPFLETIINRITTNTVNSNITYVDLLKSQGNFKSNLFNFQLNNSGVPNFNTPTLVEKYARNKTLGYIFYLKQSRPSAATKMFLFSESNKKCESIVTKKLFKLVAQNFYNTEMMASCVAFLEMTSQNSSNLRVYITAARILYESGGLTYEEVRNILENISTNPEALVDALECVLINLTLTVDHSGIDLMETIKKYNVVVKFSRIHNLRLPSLFLKHFAKNNHWLPFLILVQCYNYPMEQVQKLICNFEDCNLIEHFYHGLLNDINVDDQKTLLMRDSRKYYLSRIGVRKNVETISADGIHSSMSSYGSYTSTGSSSGSSDLFENDSMEFNTDLLLTLIRCHNSVDPPKALLQACYVYKNPMFAILATSYEPDSIISNWLTWLSVSCELEDEFSNFESTNISANLTKNLLIAVIRKSQLKILHQSFQIFLNDSPLKTFVEFLIQCTDLNFDSNCSTEKLKHFSIQLRCRKTSTVSTISTVDYEILHLSSRTWLETTAMELFATCLGYNFSSVYDQLRCLRTVHKLEIEKYFSIQLPDIKKFRDIIDSIYQSKCDVKFNLSVICDEELTRSHLLACIKQLVSLKLYGCAFEISQIVQYPVDFVLLNEWRDKFKNAHDLNFWNECESIFKSSNVQPNATVEFFESCSENVDDKMEKYHILNLAHKWVTFHSLPNLYEIEKKVWLAYFDVDAEIVDSDFIRMGTRKILYREMKESLENVPTIEINELLPENDTRIDKTIERLLNHNDLWQSLRLAKMFGRKNENLELIELCCNLAESLLMPYQLSTEQRLLLNKTSNIRSISNRRRRTFMSSRNLSSFSSVHSPLTSTLPIVDHIETPFQDTLAVLEILLQHVRHGEEIVQNLVLTFRISVNIEKSYQEVFLCDDPMLLLKQALAQDDCTNKLEVVHDFSLLFKWSKNEIADLLCEALIMSISDHLKSKLEPILLWDVNLDTDFHLILQLLPENYSILGLKLYKYANALHKSQTESYIDFKISEINLVLELLIRAHNCFTADCNMEGIASILKKCQSIVVLLLTLKSWKLIVRLLTGIARYTEMNYVFHILRENDQFEFLLRKGNRKDNGLKVALLKYLKEYCPEDRELYRMVALHFTLYSEIAQLWEEEARSIVRNLIAISKLEMQNNGLNVETQQFVLLTNTDGTKICLNKAMINYTHAAEYHLQGEKLAKAMAAARQAELLALQVSMLKGLGSNCTSICILNANDVQIAFLIATELSFSQALILIEAYSFKTDWANVLIEQFILRNRTNYLENFLDSFPLTDTIVYDISRKFVTLKTVSDSIIRNMKEILKKCTSVHVKYRIASELGFSDLVEELLAGDELAYLKDTVWKKGYKN